MGEGHGLAAQATDCKVGFSAIPPGLSGNTVFEKFVRVAHLGLFTALAGHTSGCNLRDSRQYLPEHPGQVPQEPN
jgi:hypothetical protein